MRAGAGLLVGSPEPLVNLVVERGLGGVELGFAFLAVTGIIGGEKPEIEDRSRGQGFSHARPLHEAALGVQKGLLLGRCLAPEHGVAVGKAAEAFDHVVMGLGKSDEIRAFGIFAQGLG